MTHYHVWGFEDDGGSHQCAVTPTDDELSEQQARLLALGMMADNLLGGWVLGFRDDYPDNLDDLGRNPEIDPEWIPQLRKSIETMEALAARLGVSINRDDCSTDITITPLLRIVFGEHTCSGYKGWGRIWVVECGEPCTVLDLFNGPACPTRGHRDHRKTDWGEPFFDGHDYAPMREWLDTTTVVTP